MLFRSPNATIVPAAATVNVSTTAYPANTTGSTAEPTTSSDAMVIAPTFFLLAVSAVFAAVQRV